MRTGWVSLALVGLLGCSESGQSAPTRETDGGSSSEATASSQTTTSVSSDGSAGPTGTESTGGNTGSTGARGSSTSGTTQAPDASSGVGVDTWDEAVDCENHRPTAASYIEFSGILDGVETEGRCDFLVPHDWVNFCEGEAIGFLTSCSTADGMLVSLQLAPVQAGDFDDPQGMPRYGFDILDGANTYSTGSPNAVETRMTVDTFDEDRRELAGRFEAGFYDLTVSGIRYPAGGFTGSFSIFF